MTARTEMWEIRSIYGLWRQEQRPRPPMHLKAWYLSMSLVLLCGCEHPQEHASERSVALTSKSDVTSPASVKAAPARVVGFQLGEPKSARMRIAHSSPDEDAQGKEGEALVPTLPPKEQKNVRNTLTTARRYGLSLYERGPTLDCEEVGAQAPSDAWGSRLALHCPSDEPIVQLTSLGPDRYAGTQDDIVWRQPVIADNDAPHEPVH